MQKRVFLLMVAFLFVALVSCHKKATDFTIDVPSELVVGESVTLKASTDVVWSLDDETVASLNGNILTALKAGSVNLIAQHKTDKKQQKTVKITILKKTSQVYQIIYELDGGILPEGAPRSYLENQGLASLPVPTKENYKFLGWYLNNNLITSIPATQKGDVILTAKFEALEVYQITYQLNGGILPEGSPTSYLETFGLASLPVPTKENYKFLGWYLNDNLITSIPATQKGDVILTAKFEALMVYQITYQLDGGILPADAPTSYLETVGLASLPIPTKENHEFLGWYFNNELITNIPSTQKGDMTLIALFVGPESYQITYELNGGILPEGAPTSYLETIGLESLPVPTKENYEFTGWYLANHSLARYDNISKHSKGDIVLMARWFSLINENEIVLPEAPYQFKAIKKTPHSSGNGTFVYQPDFTGSGVTNTSVMQYDWSSSDEEIATISIYSSITAKKAGYAIITAVSKNNPEIVINCIIRVTSEGVEYATLEEANEYKVYEVSFVGKDDELIETQSVIDGGAVILPTPPQYDGLKFIGWSHNNYNIKSDLVIKAQYDLGSNEYVGKKIAVIGDSISTYQGYVPAGYSTFYPYPTGDVNDINQTWWMQVINRVGAKMFVNNSYSGSTVAGSAASATQNDARLKTLLLGNEQPDVIIIFMGSNDCQSPYVSLASFNAAYQVMLDKIKVLTPNAEIILATLPKSDLYTEENRVAYNEVIVNYGNSYQLEVIDLALLDLRADLIDSAHPNRSGMTKIANKVISSLIGIINEPTITVTGENTVYINQETTLTVNVNVEGEITFSSSDEEVALVTETGVVRGLKVGTAEITITCGDLVAKFTIEVKAQEYQVTYNFNGGYSPELFIANSGDAASLKLNNYNYNNGTFWGGAYATDIFIGAKDYDPKATFSDRIYIAKNEETDLYEVISYLRSGPSSWPANAEYVITVSNSYGSYAAVKPALAKIAEGQIVVFADSIDSISASHPISVYFFNEAPTEDVMVELVSVNDELIKPVYLGYLFLGWFDSEDNKYTSGADLTEAVTLYAKWQELIKVTEIKVEAIVDNIEIGQTFQIIASVVPEDAYFKQLIYSSSNTDILTVSSSGLLEAINTGTAIIKITDYLEDVVYEIEITVYPPASVDIVLPETYQHPLKVGETLQLTAVAYGKDHSEATFEYESYDPDVITVDENGLVTAQANGEGSIGVKISGTEVITTVIVVVLEEGNESLIDQLANLIIDNHFNVVETGNVSLYNDGNQKVFVSVYGSVNRLLFTSLDIDETYYENTENNPNNHMTRRATDTIEFVAIHDTATLTGTVVNIAQVMSTGSTSIHYTVGNELVYGVVPEKYIAYHAGDGISATFEWIKTTVPALENVAPTFGITNSGSNYYLTVNGFETTIIVPYINNQPPKVANFTKLGPTWKTKDGFYYIGGPLWSSYNQISSRGGNNNSIGIEMCSNLSGDIYDTWQRTAKLVADILIRNNLDPTRVKMHNTFSGKNCPQTMIEASYWNEFMKIVELEYLLQTVYKEATITMEINNLEFLNSVGRVIKAPETTKSVSYKVKIELNGEVREFVLASLIPGSTTWEQWNGTYSSARVWNNGVFAR